MGFYTVQSAVVGRLNFKSSDYEAISLNLLITKSSQDLMVRLS